MHEWQEVAIGVERMRVLGGWIYGWTAPPGPLWAVFVPGPPDAAEARERRLRDALRALMAAHVDGAGLPQAVGPAWEAARAALAEPPDA